MISQSKWKIFSLGLVLSIVVFLFFDARPYLLLLAVCGTEMIFFIDTQVNPENINRGVFAGLIANVLFFNMVIWVYKYFKWPPKLFDVFLSGLIFIVLFLSIFVVYTYFIDRDQQSIYMHQEAMLLYLSHILINALGVVLVVFRKTVSLEFVIGIVVIGMLILWYKICINRIK